MSTQTPTRAAPTRAAVAGRVGLPAIDVDHQRPARSAGLSPAPLRFAGLAPAALPGRWWLCGSAPKTPTQGAPAERHRTAKGTYGAALPPLRPYGKHRTGATAWRPARAGFPVLASLDARPACLQLPSRYACGIAPAGPALTRIPLGGAPRSSTRGQPQKQPPKSPARTAGYFGNASPSFPVRKRPEKVGSPCVLGCFWGCPRVEDARGAGQAPRNGAPAWGPSPACRQARSCGSPRLRASASGAPSGAAARRSLRELCLAPRSENRLRAGALRSIFRRGPRNPPPSADAPMRGLAAPRDRANLAPFGARFSAARCALLASKAASFAGPLYPLRACPSAPLPAFDPRPHVSLRSTEGASSSLRELAAALRSHYAGQLRRAGSVRACLPPAWLRQAAAPALRWAWGFRSAPFARSSRLVALRAPLALVLRSGRSAAALPLAHRRPASQGRLGRSSSRASPTAVAAARVGGEVLRPAGKASHRAGCAALASSEFNVRAGRLRAQIRAEGAHCKACQQGEGWGLDLAGRRFGRASFITRSLHSGSEISTAAHGAFAPRLASLNRVKEFNRV
jgi:hypothetical protein